MKRDAKPIPLQSIVCLPRWLMVLGVAISGAGMLAGVGFLVFAIGWAEGRNEVGGAIGAAVGCLFGGGGGLFGTLGDWRRRLPATVYLPMLKNDTP
ncbi:MAG: hypothetical protein KDC98_08595, partial [Planctomycetes bacterium]|nr:hypothetical protein [Planctomycetota bacterium]